MGEWDSWQGILFIGLLFSVALWGLECSQVWRYFRSDAKDPRFVKLLVTICWLSDTVNQALFARTVYVLVVTDFSNPQAEALIPISFPLSAPFFETTALAAQGFFIYRIWLLSRKSWIWTGLATTLTATKLGCNILYTVKTIGIRLFMDLNVKAGRIVTLYVVADVATDVFIAVAMCWLLLHNRTEYQRTKSLLNKMIILTTTTGAFTGLTAVAILVVHLAAPNSPSFLNLYFVLGRLYTNALLAALNIRKHLREHPSGNGVELSLSNGKHSSRVLDRSSKPGSTALHVKVSTVQETSTDLQDPKAAYFGSDLERGGQTAHGQLVLPM